MKKLTKVMALLLALLMMTAALAGCGEKEAAPAEEAPAASDAAPAPAEETPAEQEGFTTATEGYLTMATHATFPPYEMYEGTEIVGIDAEIGAAIAEKLGLQFKIEDMEFDSIITAVSGGKADIGLAGMTYTEERLESVDFTTSYTTGRQVIILKEDNDTIAGTNENLQLVDKDGNVLEGLVIGVQRDTTGDLYTTWNMGDTGLATIDRYSKGADAVMALVTGKVDCVITDNEPAKNYIAESEGLTILEADYIEEAYCGAMSKDNPALYTAVNTALEELLNDGTVQAIIDKYIPAE